MHLAFIVQLAIALLARELAGAIALGPWAGGAIAVSGPLLVLILGNRAAHRALRRMDRAESGAAEEFFASNARSGWIVALFLFLAASTDFPAAMSGPVWGAFVVAYLLGCGIGGTLAASWNGWLVEMRIREAGIVGTLDRARPLQAFPTRGAYVLAQVRAGLAPALVPLLLPILFGALAQQVAHAYAPGWESIAQLGGAVTGILLLFLSIPLLIPPLLGLVRLPPGEMRDDLERLAASSGIGVREIWIWPTDGLVANAAVMGVFPRLRCVMLSDALLECMPREQVLAVLAHELGHVARRHIAWMLPVIVACWTLGALITDPLAHALYALMQPAAERGELGVAEEVQALVASIALVRDLGMAVFGLLAFGFVSRRFERQADTDAVRLLSAQEGSGELTTRAVVAMSGALTSVAFLNHVPLERPSWRHGSIAWRQGHLRTLVGAPSGALPNDRFVSTICLGSIVLVLAAVAWTAASSFA